ncbi:hypothetical protein [Phycicoccus sp. Soil803]|uniref:hypothetical protein n=1 Tax=Phycicoccus sp. Soil803 TaxID=1736415 RepID=UPI00070CFC43|nr:hypothetical protein [Phycicoccus sp. Soil803]KRF23974.1 hypothetical protein ASG95_04870 [Phycicoccus sp. Soil803]
MANPTLKARPELVSDGWRKRAGAFYTRPLAPGVAGLLGLAPNRGLPYQWRLQPFVGVIHERVNQVAGALTDATAKSPYPQATIRQSLVGLLDGMDAQDRERWVVATEAPDGNERVFRDVAAAVRDNGLSWMEERTSLDAVVRELRAGNGPVRLTPYLTAALWLQGEVVAAEERLTEIAAQFGGPALQVPEPVRDLRVASFASSSPPEGWPRHAFDAFAARLREGMQRYPQCPPERWQPRTG